VVEVIRRGQVWVANLNPPRGRELGKLRPVVVMQADELIASGSTMVIVLPLTTRVYPGFRRWRVTVSARDRLLKDSQVVVDQPRALDRARLGDGPLTTLTDAEMAAVEKSLRGVLGML
jgi:mRNA interferase MazF